MMVIPTMHTISATSSSQPQNSSPVELAARTNRLVLVGYITSLLVVALMTYLSWRAGNKAQEAIKADADARIAEAHGTATEAEARAAEAGKVAAKATEAAALANERAAGAEVQIASARASAAEAMRVAETERLARVKLEAEIAPRRLSEAQRQAVMKTCKFFAGRAPVNLVSYSLDAEAAVLGTQILETLGSAGIEVKGNLASIMPLGGFSLGVHVSGPRSEQTLVTTLAVSLATDGGLAVALPELGADGGPIQILVGVKPVK